MLCCFEEEKGLGQLETFFFLSGRFTTTILKPRLSTVIAVLAVVLRGHSQKQLFFWGRAKVNFVVLVVFLILFDYLLFKDQFSKL